MGTSFNVLNRENIFEVMCETGSVSVEVNDEVETLVAKEKIKCLGSEKGFKSENVLMKRSDWREGIFHYDGHLLGTIIKDIERNLMVEIELENDLEKLNFTGSFNSENLDRALSEVCWPLGLEFERLDRNVRIFKN